MTPQTLAILSAAAVAEIAGCFAFWAAVRAGKPVWWLIPGILFLALFAWLLTLSPAEAAGRAYAAYGGIYIAAALIWMIAVEQVPATRWDIIGVGLGLAGCVVILAQPR